MDDHFDTTAGLLFEAEVTTVSFEKRVQGEEAEGRVAVFRLVLMIGVNGGLYCR